MSSLNEEFKILEASGTYVAFEAFFGMEVKIHMVRNHSFEENYYKTLEFAA